MKIIPNKKKNLYAMIAVFLCLHFLAFGIMINFILSERDSQLTDSKSINSGVDVPILMYHGLIKDPKLQNKFFISPTTFENDLDYLSKNGYTTISMKELIDYVETDDANLPEKPIILTFDDGYYNNYFYAFPILKEKNAKATISIIGALTEKFSQVDENNPAYSHVTWTQIKEMLNSNLIEIQNHTMDMHTYDKGRKGATQNTNESLEAYKKVLENDVGALQNRIEEMTGQRPNTFTYPFGFVGKNSDDLLKDMGFKATLGCEEGINVIEKDPECLYGLKRILRPLNGSLAEIL